MKLEIWPENAAETAIVVAAMLEIQRLRDVERDKHTLIALGDYARDVPAMTLAECNDESRRSAEVEAHAIEHPPASIDDAVAAMKAALARGVPMPQIVAVLVEKKVVRVTELNPADRSEFVVRLGALVA